MKKDFYKTKIVYKVTTLNNKSINNSLYNLQYKLNKITKPLFGKIFCFETLEDTINFKNYYSGYKYKIFKCKGYNVIKVYKLYIALFNKEIKDYWDGKEKINIKTAIPKGTLWCDKIKLLEQIDN